MNWATWSAFVATVLVLMSTPGPSHLLMLANSIANGYRRALATAAGDLCANFLQMAVAATGLAGLVYSSSRFFLWVKWLGVIYLVFLGFRAIFGALPACAGSARVARSARVLYWQGFVTSAANPKAVLFFAALFPQFLDTTRPLVGQFLLLSTTYLAIDGVFLLSYGRGAAWIAQRLNDGGMARLQRVAGGLLIGAAVLLGMKDVDSH